MKVKRFFAFVLTLCMLVPLLPTVTVSAASAPTIKYYVLLIRKDDNDATTDKNSVKVKLEFTDGYSKEFTMKDVNNKKKRTTATDWQDMDGRYPWMLQRVSVRNTSKNDYILYNLSVSYSYNGKIMELASTYPGGYDENWKTGMKIGQGDGQVRTYSVVPDSGRKITSLENLQKKLKSNILFSDDTESTYNDTKDYLMEWHGSPDDSTKVIDQYEKFKYYAYKVDNESKDKGEPQITTKISAYSSSNKSFSETDFKESDYQSKGLAVTSYGYKYNKKNLHSYMKKNNINEVRVETTVKVPKRVSMSDCYTETVVSTFTRDYFGISDVVFKYPNLSLDSDNNYYNLNNKQMIIETEAQLNLSSPEFKHLNDGRFEGQTLTFDDMYLEWKENNVVVDKVYLEDKNVKSFKVSGGKIYPKFKYSENMDTNNVGLRFVIYNGKITDKNGRKYKLSSEWFVNQNLRYKIDAKKPELSVSSAGDTDFDKWNTEAKINLKSTEKVYPVGDKKRTQEVANLKLVKKGTTAAVQYKLWESLLSGTTPKNVGTGGITVPVLTNGQNMKISVPDGVEGEYQLLLECEDLGGNKISEVLPTVLKLDKKAPTVGVELAVKDKDGKPQEAIKTGSNGEKNAEYAVTLNDASGSGRLYYMFTEKTLEEVKKNPPSTELKGSTGDITVKREEWMAVDQNKTVSLLLQVPKGDAFYGNVIYYGKDDAGNQTEYKSLPVSINNEDVSFEVTPDSASLKPSKGYVIGINTVDSNKVEYCWYKNGFDDEGKSSRTYAFGYQSGTKATPVYKTCNGTIDTAKDSSTEKLDGAWNLVVKITGKYGTVTEKEYTYIFDNAAPKISFTKSSGTDYTNLNTVGITVKDAGIGVSSESGDTYAQIVNADGSEIEGNGSIPLNVNSDMEVIETIAPSNLKSGAYAIKVKATDINGLSDEKTSEVFYVRNGALSGTVKADSGKKLGDTVIVGKNEKAYFDFDLNEEFSNPASDTRNQALYFRASTKADSFDEKWIKAGTADKANSGYSANLRVQVPDFAYLSGINRVYVQTALCPDWVAEDKAADYIKASNIRTDEVSFTYDDEKPNGYLVLSDEPTKNSITGKLYVEDMIPDGIIAECENDAVTIGAYTLSNSETEKTGGEFSVTVDANVDTKIILKDLAGNINEVPLKVTCIDKQPPTAAVKTDCSVMDERQDATATVDVYDMAEAKSTVEVSADEKEKIGSEDENELYGGSSDSITLDTAAVDKSMFALIPKDVYDSADKQNYTIPDTYFKENLSDDIVFDVNEVRSENASREGEFNKTYSIKVAGADGEWYLALRTEDSLGNSADIVFDGEDNVLETKYPTLDMEYTVSPILAEKYSVVSLEFNRPVYVLPQNKVTDDDDANYNAAKQLGFSYSNKASFMITENGTYNIYTADDLGRTTKKSVEISGVTFNSSNDFKLNYKLYADVNNYATPGLSNLTEIKPDEVTGEYKMICPDGIQAAYYIEVSAVNKTENDTTRRYLLPSENYIAERWSNGFYFEQYLSEEYAYNSNGTAIKDIGTDDTDESDDTSESKEIAGYEKLYYKIEQIYGTQDDSTERMLDVRAFSELTSNEKAIKTLVVPNIDNTPPKVEWSVSPEVLVRREEGDTSGLEGLFNSDDEIDPTLMYWKKKPTPGSVSFILKAQDAESGISKVVALSYPSSFDDPSDTENYTDIVVDPDDDGYWCWDGSTQNMVIDSKWDETKGESGGYVYTRGNLPLKIEYFQDSNDPYGVKTLIYTYDEEVDLDSLGYSGAMFITAGGVTNDNNAKEEHISFFSTKGLICKLPIEKGVDYDVVYTLSDGTVITEADIEKNYYNNVTATIKIAGEDSESSASVGENRGVNRGMFITNNGGSNTVSLNAYQKTFTFKLRDKFGYEATETVEIKNVDITPGKIESIVFSETGKTNVPYGVTITASDEDSGVDNVKLYYDGKALELTQQTQSVPNNKKKTFSGTISANGNYGVEMYDNSGNKTIENFNISNISTVKPAITTVTYSAEDKTWTDEEPAGFFTVRPVTAELTYSKQNVSIISTEPAAPLTKDDYTVNTGDGTIVLKKSGTVGVEVMDDYGNTNKTVVSTNVIDDTPPVVALYDADNDNKGDIEYDEGSRTAIVRFEKVSNAASGRDNLRTEENIYVSYGGVTKSVAEAVGEGANRKLVKNTFAFSENGDYTFRVFDKDGMTSYLNIKIEGIDKSSPKITSVKYSYEVYDADTQTTRTVTKDITPKEGTIGYRVAVDSENPVTNRDVTVKLETDAETKLLGSEDEYSTTQEKVYDKNGYFVFNPQKKNGMVSSYGVDIQVIDKTPPVIDLGGTEELIFYENPKMGSAYSKDLLTYSAYDIFFGVKTDLTSRVVVDYGDFNPDNIEENDFDASKQYVITYTVSDDANNKKTVQRKIRLIGKNDTVAMVNGIIPDYSGKAVVPGDTVTVSLKNFNSVAYARYTNGIYTMGQMKTMGTLLSRNDNGDFEVSGLERGWYTFYIQTDKRDYFTISVYVTN